MSTAETVASVAAAAQITDAGLLYHFLTKEDLFLAVVIHHDELGARRLAFLEHLHEPSIETIQWLASLGDWMEDDAQLQALHVSISAESLQPGTA